MGVSVRQQKRDGKWYLYIRHAGERASKRYDTEEAANAVAAAVRYKIGLGEFDIAAVKHQAKEDVGPSLTLEQFYNDTVLPCWEGSLSRATYLSYEGSFRVHILPELGELALIDVTRDRIKLLLTKLRKKEVGNSQQTDDPETQPRLLSKETIRNIVAALRS